MSALQKALIVMLLVAPAMAVADSGEKATAELGVEALESIDSGFLFKDGRYMDAPYLIERRGTDIYVNGELFRRGPEWPPYDWAVNDDPGDPPLDWSPLGPVRQGDPRDDYWARKWRFLAQHHEQAETRQLMIETYRKSPFVKDVLLERPDLSSIELLGQNDERVKVSLGGGGLPPPQTNEQYLAHVRRSMGYLARSLRKGETWCDFHNGCMITGGMPSSHGLEILASTRPAEEKTKLVEEQRLFATELPETKQLISDFRASPKFLQRIESLRRTEAEEKVKSELRTASSVGQTVPTTGVSAVIPGTGLSVSDVCEGISGRAQRLSTRTAVIKETWYGAGNIPDLGAVDNSRPIFQWSYHFYRANNGFRYDRRSMGDNSLASKKVEIEAWDGKESTSLVEDPQANPDRRFSGVVAADQNALATTVYWRTFVEDSVLMLDLPFGELMTRAKWKPLGTKLIDSYRTVGLTTIDGIKGHPDYDIQLWVSPEHDFAPVHLMLQFRSGNEVRFAAELKEVKLERRDGIAVPVAGKIETYDFSNDRGGAKVIFVYALDQFQCTVPEGIRDFKLKFPVGTGVWDDIAKMSFIAGKVAMIRSADGMHYYVPIQAFPEYVKRTDYSKGLDEEEWRQAAKARQIDVNMLKRPPTAQELDSRSNAASPNPAASSTQTIPLAPPPVDEPQGFPWMVLAIGSAMLLGGLGVWRIWAWRDKGAK